MALTDGRLINTNAASPRPQLTQPLLDITAGPVYDVEWHQASLTTCVII